MFWKIGPYKMNNSKEEKLMKGQEFYYSTIAKLRDALHTRATNLGISAEEIANQSSKVYRLEDIDPSEEYFLGGERESILALCSFFKQFEESLVPQTVDEFYNLNKYAANTYMDDASDLLDAYKQLHLIYEHTMERLHNEVSKYKSLSKQQAENEPKDELEVIDMVKRLAHLMNLQVVNEPKDELEVVDMVKGVAQLKKLQDEP